MRGWRRRLALGAAIAGLALVGWGFLVEPGLIRMRTVPIALPSWPSSLDGLRVAVMGDVHTGSPHISVDRLRALVAEVNGASPDVVVLLGDYVIHGVLGGRFVEPEITAEVLGELRAPGGIVAVLGNHDWWYDGTRVRKALEARGIVVLENEAHRIVHEGSVFWLAGLADLWTRQPDIDGTLRDIPPGDPVLLLTHSPDVFPDVPSRVAVTLAAHTHGGQVRLPPFPAPVVPSRYASRYAGGHVIEGGRHLFVTTGVGTSIMPVRFGVPPEVAILTLHPVPPAR